jgi:hypothetical protein
LTRERSDRVAGWATGAGIGLIALMVTWLVGSRLAVLVWDPPVGPIVAFGGAVVIGILTTFIAGRRLSRPRRSPDV